MNQDIRDNLKRLEVSIENDARANDLLRGRLVEQEQIVTQERARADKAEKERDKIARAADQAISNLRAIVALNDDPHIDEICRVTAEELGIALPTTDHHEAALLRAARGEAKE